MGRPPSWREMESGFVIKKPGSAAANITGDWRTMKPEIDYDKCTRCGICWVYCPEPAILLREGRYEVDYTYCKGCGICAVECPVKCIRMVREEE